MEQIIQQVTPQLLKAAWMLKVWKGGRIIPLNTLLLQDYKSLSYVL